jgi:hypothetical protein
MGVRVPVRVGVLVPIVHMHMIVSRMARMTGMFVSEALDVSHLSGRDRVDDGFWDNAKMFFQQVAEHRLGAERCRFGMAVGVWMRVRMWMRMSMIMSVGLVGCMVVGLQTDIEGIERETVIPEAGQEVSVRHNTAVKAIRQHGRLRSLNHGHWVRSRRVLLTARGGRLGRRRLS